MCDMTRSHVCHDLFTCVPCLFSWGDMRRYLKIAITSLHIGTMTRSRVCRKLFTCVTWYIHMCAMTYPQVWLVLSAEAIFSHVWHDCFTFVTWLVHHDSSTCVHKWGDMKLSLKIARWLACILVPWLEHMCAMTRKHAEAIWDDISRFRLQVCILDPRLFYMCIMTCSHVYHDSYTCVPWLHVWLVKIWGGFDS